MDRRARRVAEARSIGETLRVRLGRRHYLQVRLEDEKQCVLVLIGATPGGRNEFIGLTDGAGKITRDRRELLLGLKTAPARCAAGIGRRRAQILKGFRRSQADHPRAPESVNAAEEPTAEGQTLPAGDLDGRDEGGPRLRSMPSSIATR
jgi:hypothetical protein